MKPSNLSRIWMVGALLSIAVFLLVMAWDRQSSKKFDPWTGRTLAGDSEKAGAGKKADEPRLFRQDDKNHWREVDPRDCKKGDVLITLGVTDKSLWALEIWEVGPKGYYKDKDEQEKLEVVAGQKFVDEKMPTKLHRIELLEKPAEAAKDGKEVRPKPKP